MIFAECDSAMESFGMMIRGICDGLFGAEYTGSTTASSCVGEEGVCYDSVYGISNSCCSGLTCTPQSSRTFTCKATTAPVCVASGGTCYDAMTGTSFTCCSGLSCIPPSFTCAGGK